MKTYIKFLFSLTLSNSKALTLLLAGIFILFIGEVNNLLAQTQCDNTPWAIGPQFIGIQTGNGNNALKPLHIDGFYSQGTSCPDPAIRLSFRAWPQYWGHLVMQTPYNNYYSTFSTEKDLILQNDSCAEDLILTTRNEDGYIRFGTTPTAGGSDIERMKILPDGKVGIGLVYSDDPIGILDINLKGWDYNLPKISFNHTNSDPSIRLYRPTGTDYNPDGLSYPWWIECANDYLGVLNFRSHNAHPWFAKIGQETTVTRVAFRSNGNVGVNNGNPQVKLQVTEGNVVFDGNDDGNYEVLPTGAGTRFMWIPQKAAIRAGGVTGTEWNYSPNIGYNSAAFGLDCIASGSFTIASGKDCIAGATGAAAFGNDNEVTGENSAAFGNQNVVSGDISVAFGSANEVSSHFSAAFGADNKCEDYSYSMAFGFNNTSSGSASAAIGYQSVAEGDQSIAIGQECIASSQNSIAIGYKADASAAYAQAYGNAVEADALNSTAMGYGISTYGNAGSFVIGDHNSTGLTCTPATNRDQMVMRFTGDPSGTITQKVIRFITAVDGSCNIINEAFLTRGSNDLITTSDRNKKREINQVDEYDILKRLRNVPVSTWKWKVHTALDGNVQVVDSISNTWMGPMAQDFYSQFPIGHPDSTTLSTSVMGAVMMASIQSLANIADTIKAEVLETKDKADILEEKVESSVTWNEFNTFRDSIKCFANVCERVDTLEKNIDNMVAKNEFNTFRDSIVKKEDFDSFRDSIDCYADACDRINELESQIEDLKTRIDSLEAKDGGIIEEEDKSDNLLSITNYDDIILGQNNPNPFAETTEINYYIPEKYKGKAKLILANESGIKMLQQFDICNGKPCQITISAKDLTTGVYLYGIVLNGRIVKSNKMMIIK